MSPIWMPSAGITSREVLQAAPHADLALQADLERARGEYALARIEPTAKILEDLLAKLRANLQRSSQPTSIHQVFLLASAQCLKGRLLWRGGDKTAAQAVFESSASLFGQHSAEIAAQKSNSRLYTDYGIALYRLNRPLEAIDVLHKACATGAGSAEAFGYLGLAYRDTNLFNDALSALQSSLQLSPGQQHITAALAETLARAGKKAEALPAYYEAARIAVQKGDMKESERLLSQALALDQTYPDALFLSVMLARWRGDEQGAMALVDRTLDIDPKHSWALGLKATMLYDAGDRQRAIQLYQRIKITSPELSWVLVNWAEALHDVAHDAEALALLDRAIELNRDDPEPFVLKSTILASTDAAKAEAVLEDAAQEHPQSISVRLAIAQLALRNKRDDVANQALDTILLIDRRNVPALMAKAELLETQKRFDEALDMLRRAASVPSENPDIAPRIARVLYKQEHINEALEELATAIAHDPKHWKAYWMQGTILLSQNQLPDGLQSFQNAVRIRPDDADLHADFGEALRQLDHYEEACKVFDRALQLAPNSANVCLFKAFYLCDIADFRQAIAFLQRGAELDPRNDVVYWLMGWAYQHLGRAEAANAERAFQRVLELTPKVTSNRLAARKGLANVWYDAGRHDDAGQIFKELIDEQTLLEGNSARVNRIALLGWCYYRLRQYDEAVRLFQSCISISQNNIDVHFDLALALLASGRSSAGAEYERAIERATSKHLLRQRGLFYIALYDVVTGIAEGRMRQDVQSVIDRLRGCLRTAGVDLAKVPWLDDGVSIRAPQA
jgi:tetratricopeptide (TPR) repeat protein